MADNTKIEWADATLNYVNGCTRISPGCGGPGPHGGCYAERLAGTRMRNHASRAGLTRDTENGPRWTGEIRLNEKALQQAMSWRRPRRIFWNAHGDLFHDNVPDEAIDRLFAVFALTPHHTHLILTKRAARMRAYMAQLDIYALEETEEWRTASYRIDCDDDPNGSPAWHSRTAELEDCFVETKRRFDGGLPLPNVWLGVSVEDQQRADERSENFRATKAAVKFVSYEPALGPVDWRGWEFIDQFIGGGESGPRARPMHPDWQRATRDFCAKHGKAYFFKQWGEWIPEGQTLAHPVKINLFNRAWVTAADGENRYTQDAAAVHPVGKKAAGRLLDGVEHNAMPSGGR